MTTVRGIRVTDRMLQRWRAWTMPPVQPFIVPDKEARGLPQRSRTLSAEWRDTFSLPDEFPEGHKLIWLDKAGAKLLTAETLAAQPTTHRWPTASEPYDIKRSIGFVTQGTAASRHGDVPDATWKRAAELLPEARRVSGRFRDRSGPDALGAVMSAAGIETDSPATETFEQWLSEVTIPGGNDELPGTIYVWRDDDGTIRHAGVSLGDGWYLHKDSAGWFAPTVVLDVRDGINASRTAGQFIERHTIIPARLR